MRLVILCLFLAGSSISPARAAASGGGRTFTARFDRLAATGYAEVVEEFQYPKARLANESHIWFTRDGRYRTESSVVSSSSTESGSWEYPAYDGRRLYVALADPTSTHEANWRTYPVRDAADSVLGTYMSDSWKVSNARMIGIGRVLGLRADHWRGRDSQYNRSRDVWVSSDRRFPLVLRVLDKSKDSAVEWRITKLDLKHRVPDYIFTAQVHPKPEFLRILTTPHKPPFVTLIWHAMVFLAYAGGVASFAWRRPTFGLRRRIVLGVGACAAFALLVIWGPAQETCTRTFSGTPMVLAYAALCVLLVLFMLRVFGRPSGVALFRGTTVFSLLLVLGAAYLGVRIGERYPWHYLGLMHSLKLVFFPGILVKAVLGMGCITAVEELIFRGYLFSALEAGLRRMWAVIVVQAVIFGVYHVPGRLAAGDSLPHLAASVAWLSGSGLLFGVLRWRYRNLAVPWLVHFAHNAGWLYVVTLYTDYITRFNVGP
jgi:membrane protease YdiL (CAAX protease family)